MKKPPDEPAPPYAGFRQGGITWRALATLNPDRHEVHRRWLAEDEARGFKPSSEAVMMRDRVGHGRRQNADVQRAVDSGRKSR